MTTPIRLALAVGAIAVGQTTAWAQDAPVQQGERNAPDLAPAFAEQTRAPESASGIALAVEEVAGGLEHPWGMALLPGGELLVTERPGRLRLIDAEGSVSDPVGGVPEVLAESQGGLLDVAVSPTFAEDRLVYLTYSKPTGDGMSVTAAARGRLADDLVRLEDVTDIFVQSPPSPTPMHYGSRAVFAGDRHLFVTTGEHSSGEERGLSQDLGTTYGKVMRFRPNGSVPPDNPFVGEPGVVEGIWTYGHRNVQGAAIDPATGLFWTVEHGPRGGDELNLSTPGANYGWPVVSYGIEYGGGSVGQGITSGRDFQEPVYFWDPVIAPGGMTFYQGDAFADWQGDLLIASLDPGALVRLEIAGKEVGETPRVVGEERLLTDVGRIRDVEVAPDGAILVLTDAEDGSVLELTPENATN